MRLAEYILEEIAHIAGRKLTRTDIRKLRSLIAQLPADKVNKLMCIINENPKTSSKEITELLLYSMSYRLRLPIKEMYTYQDFRYGELGFYLCPQCGTAIEFDFQKFCGSCGQALGWDNYKNVTVRKAGVPSYIEKEELIDEPMPDKQPLLV